MSENRATLERQTTDDAVSLSAEERDLAVVLDKRPAEPGTERPLRILHINTRLAVGGPAFYCISMAERIQGPDFVSGILVGDVEPTEGSMEGLAAERGVQFMRVPGLGREIAPTSDALALARMVREVRRFHPDIVHTHCSKAGVLGRIAARSARVPVVIHTYHANIFDGYFSKRKSALFLRIERTLGHLTDRVIVLSETQEREMQECAVVAPEKMVRIPLGLELEPFLQAQKQRGQLRQELEVSPDTPLVGIVARLVPIKRHSLFLEMARQVADARPDTHFVIVGGGELRQALEQQALDLGFRVQAHMPGQPPLSRVPLTISSQNAGPKAPCSTVHFLGFRSDLPSIYADLDVVVLCSLNETFAATIAEALAAARPVVATDVGAMRELIAPQDAEHLIRTGDPPGLSQGVLQMLNNPRLAHVIGERNCARVYPHLSVERMERDLRRLYADLARAKNLL
jgi:glycosyltransferase involved in cell wall biosynthesis